MKYGYARVSTDDQNPALQFAARQKAGCKTDQFKGDGLSCATTKRPALIRCLKNWNAATLIVWKLDHLGSSLRDLITMPDDRREIPIANGSDRHRPAAMWQMIGAVAELERSLISERTRVGVKTPQPRA